MQFQKSCLILVPGQRGSRHRRGACQGLLIAGQERGRGPTAAAAAAAAAEGDRSVQPRRPPGVADGTHSVAGKT